MSRTRNQRRRDRIFETVVLIFLAVVVIGLTIETIVQHREMEDLREQMAERGAIVVRAENYLPAHFDRSAYEAASKRYEIEQGHIIPGQKEAAPELAGSEAGDTENSAS